MRSCIRTMLGAELSQVSLLYFLSYVASAGNIRNLIEATANTAQEYKIKVSTFLAHLFFEKKIELLSSHERRRLRRHPFKFCV